MDMIILADDLTGAADSAARCIHVGLPAVIALPPVTAPSVTGALAFTSDSRHLPPRAAAQRVRDLAAPLAGMMAGARWFKKIDSTLRGNIGAEVEALLDVLPRYERAIISPAFPAQGRGLRDGRLVHPDSPPRARHLLAILAAQARGPVAFIPLVDVADPERLRAAMVRRWAQGARLLAIDAMSDADLTRIVAATNAGPRGVLLCGSAGLVGALAKEMGAPAPRTPMDVTASRIVIVVGSGSEMAHRQIATLARAPWASVHALTPTGEIDPPLSSVDPFAEGYGAWLLHLPRPAAGTPLDGPAARAAATRLTEAAADLIRRVQPQALILVGGDTAMGVLTRLQFTRLETLAELLPGMPLTRPDEGASETNDSVVWVALKAGNHGDETTLMTLVGKCGLKRPA